MALKDWKRNKVTDDYIEFRHKKRDLILLVERIRRDYNGRTDYWRVTVGGSIRRICVANNINSENLALKYAINYMENS